MFFQYFSCFQENWLDKFLYRAGKYVKPHKNVQEDFIIIDAHRITNDV